jgi:hypothetical protein
MTSATGILLRFGKLVVSLGILAGALLVAVSVLSVGSVVFGEIYALGGQTTGGDGVPDQGDVASVLKGDMISGSAACRGQRVDAPDRDGDGLPDAWERAGATPGGATLPGADPDRKDLYVQLNHGSNVDPLSATERRQLRRVWAEMPVENPDGSTGVSVHLVHEGDGAGGLGEPAAFGPEFSPERHYTEARLGDRRCVYRQVTYGRIEAAAVGGKASGPGYAAVVEGDPPAYDGTVSLRVAVTTHELLHTTAGPVDGEPHTSRGWLSPRLRPDGSDEYLSGRTAQHLNRTGLYGPAV